MVQSYIARVVLFLIVLHPVCSSTTVASDAVKDRRSLDIRLFIDVSADSVSPDEAHYLRQWLEGYLHVLPADARVGVWRFVKTPEEVLPISNQPAGNVGVGYRVMPQVLSDLPAALAAVSVEPVAAGAVLERTIIVLTDGGVNVSASPITNAHAARSLLTELVPVLAESGVTIHTVALGEEADGFLLRALAHGTGGLDFQVRSLTNLPAALLQLLDVTAPGSSVTVHNEAFTIGESDRELRMLLARLPGSSAILTDGTQTQWSEDLPLVGSQWLADSTLELVTMSQPSPGRWQMSGVDVNSSVIAVQQGLGIVSGRLESVVPAGSVQRWRLQVPAAGSMSARDGFALAVEITAPQGDQQFISVASAGSGVAGQEYGVDLPVFDRPGRYRILARVDDIGLSRQSVAWVEVLPTGTNQSITTRSRAESEQDFHQPVIGLAALGLLALAALAWVLRQRRQRKLELWHRRFQDPE